MKKINLLIFLSLYCFLNAFSQDLIVTKEGDSINCTITNVKSDYIYFTFNHKGEIRNTLLPSNAVTYTQTGFYQKAEVPLDKVMIGYEIFPHWRFAINGGFTNRTAQIPPGLTTAQQNYIRGIKSGSHFGGEICYYYSPKSGIGFKYLKSNSSNEYDGVVTATLPDNSTISGPMSDDITISYIGPYFSGRAMSKDKKHTFYCNAGLGYMGYVDRAIFINSFKISGSCVGTNLDLGYEYNLGDDIYLGFQLAYLSGLITSVTLSAGTETQEVELSEDEYEGLQRFDFSIGLRVYLK